GARAGRGAAHRLGRCAPTPRARRPPDHQRAPGHARPPRPAPPHRTDGGPPRDEARGFRDLRYGTWPVRRGPRASLRALLHDQALWGGYGARTLRVPRDRARAPRLRRPRGASGPGRNLPRGAARAGTESRLSEERRPATRCP